MRQLRHENLVGYLFVADQGSKISIVMEWAGDSLREHRTVTAPKQYCEAVARHMVYQLTHALVYLHQKVRHLLHRARPVLSWVQQAARYGSWLWQGVPSGNHRHAKLRWWWASDHSAVCRSCLTI